MIAVTGWTWEYIDNYMTLPRLYEMLTYLRKWPPVYKLVAAFIGYKEPVVLTEVESKTDEFISAVAQVNAAMTGR